MPEYLAKYTVNAFEFDGACFRPFLEPDKPEYRFQAKDEKEARERAEEHMKTFRKEYFVPQSTLDSLSEVKDIKL